jgi:hypothetical protein
LRRSCRAERVWCARILLVFLGFTGAVAHAQPASKPAPEPKVQTWSLDQDGREPPDWSPLLSHEEHLFLPVLRDPMERVKRGEAGSFEEVIRIAYNLMAAYGRNEGHAVTFDLSDFKTVYTPDALNRSLSDFISVDSLDRITVGGVTTQWVRDGRKAPAKRGYSMRWAPAPPDQDGGAWKNLLLREYIKLSMPEQPALPYLRAVTSDRVAVKLDGIRREYRAAFLWMGSSASQAIQTLSCLDPVTERVTLVLTEQVPPEGEGNASDRETPGGLSSISQPAAFGTCQVYTQYPSTRLFEQKDYDRHAAGAGNYHEITSEFDISCSCSSYCESICYPTQVAEGCIDTGGTQFGYHVAATDRRITPGNVVDALGPTGASCQGLYACAMAQCATPYCSFSITLNGTGPGFTSNPSGAAFWGTTFVQPATCGGCERAPETPPDPEIPKVECPVLIALNGKHLEMTDAASGVKFDLDRDGVAERLSWPAAGSSWAFLARDRNLNGRIDNGGELFGNYSPQPLEGKNPNGYAALTVFDQPDFGGNGDAVLDARDQIFASLVLWIDEDHDGVSQRGELKPVTGMIKEIGLRPVESRSRDRYGNQFRYRGAVTLADGKKSHSVDVFLLTEP